MDLKSMFKLYKNTKYNICYINKKIKKVAINGFQNYGIYNSINSYNKIIEYREIELNILKNYIVCKEIINQLGSKKWSKALIDVYTSTKTIQTIADENNLSIRSLFREKEKVEKFYSKIDLEDIWKHCLTCYQKRKQKNIEQ